MSDAARLKSTQHNGTMMFPVCEFSDTANPLIVFHTDAEHLITCYPDVMPDDEMPVLDASGELLAIAKHNLDVLLDRDLVVSKMPVSQGVLWERRGNYIVDQSTGIPVCELADNDYIDTHARMILLSRASLQCLQALHTILQRQSYIDPVRDKDFVDSVLQVLTAAGCDNVTPVI